MGEFVKRVVAALAVATAVVGSLVPSAPGRADIPAAITWTVDHDAKTVTVSARLLLYSACWFPPPDPSNVANICVVPPDLAAKVKQAIESIWNHGYRYACYSLNVVADVITDNTVTVFTLPHDRVGVQMERSPVADFRSTVTGVGDATSAWDSESPDDRFVVTNRLVAPARWIADPRTRNTWAHEFGHVIGLDDAYENVSDGRSGIVPQPRPGAAIDLMTTSWIGSIDQSTIDRVVRRSGNVHDLDLRCPLEAHWNEGELAISGTKCDGAKGVWHLVETMDVGGVDFDAGIDVTIGEDGTGTWSATFIGTIPVGQVTDVDSGPASYDQTVHPNILTLVTDQGDLELVVTPIGDCPPP